MLRRWCVCWSRAGSPISAAFSNAPFSRLHAQLTALAHQLQLIGHADEADRP